jgi:hypothetical protein
LQVERSAYDTIAIGYGNTFLEKFWKSLTGCAVRRQIRLRKSFTR